MPFLTWSNYNPFNVLSDPSPPCPIYRAPTITHPTSLFSHVLPRTLRSHSAQCHTPTTSYLQRFNHISSVTLPHLVLFEMMQNIPNATLQLSTISYLKRSTYNRFNVAFGPDPTYDSIPTCPMSTSKHCPTYIPVTACPTSPLNHVKPSTIKLMSDHVVRQTPNHSPHYVSFPSCSTHKDPVPTGSPWLFNPVLPTTI